MKKRPINSQVVGDARPSRCQGSSAQERSADTARPETACEASACLLPRSDTESRPMKTLRYGFGEAGRRVFDPRQEAE